ncbi:MAG: Asp23/Gls24 family envelope stress response protein [Clostridiales bacterium]|jgi:uncharacterized alkaline shock family protein YloU|nr:Asp23/Gls24 family envelope stress response protein [Clostridiales bacterium]
MTEIKIDTEGAGQVKLADEVIAIIAGTAAMEVEGVAGMSGNLTGDIAQMLGRRNLSKGVAVEVDGGGVKVTLNLLCEFGYKLQEVSEAVQRRVKAAIENMIGLNAREININITGILYYNNGGVSKKNCQKRIKSGYNEP